MRFRKGLAVCAAISIHILAAIFLTFPGFRVVEKIYEGRQPSFAINVVRNPKTSDDVALGGRETNVSDGNVEGPRPSRDDKKPETKAEPPRRFANPTLDPLRDVEPLPFTPEFRAWAQGNGTGPGDEGQKPAGRIGVGVPRKGDPLAAVRRFQCLTEARQGKRGLECVGPGGLLFVGKPLDEVNDDPLLKPEPGVRSTETFEFVDDYAAGPSQPPAHSTQEEYGAKAPETQRATKQRIENGRGGR